MVLPAPLGPSTTQRSPSATSQSTPSTRVAPSRRTLTCEKCSTSDMRPNLSSGRRPTLTGVRELPSAGRLAAWGSAALSGAVSPDEAADQVARPARPGPPGRRPARRADDGEPGLRARPGCASLGVTGLRLVLPRPGDASGLPGPPAFNERAVGRGEAVLTVGGPPLGLLDETARHLVGAPGRARPADADLAAPTRRQALHGVIREAAAVLARLDVARWEPAAAEVLAARSRSVRPALPRVGRPERAPGARAGAADLGDRRARPVRRRRGGHAGEAAARAAVLRDLDDAARRAVEAACSPPPG